MPIEFNSFVHRFSTSPGVIPSPVELYPGELALNLADGKIFTLNMSGQVIDLTALNSQFSLTGGADGDVLTYDAATGRFIPLPINGGDY